MGDPFLDSCSYWHPHITESVGGRSKRCSEVNGGCMRTPCASVRPPPRCITKTLPLMSGSDRSAILKWVRTCIGSNPQDQPVLTISVHLVQYVMQNQIRILFGFLCRWVLRDHFHVPEPPLHFGRIIQNTTVSNEFTGSHILIQFCFYARDFGAIVLCLITNNNNLIPHYPIWAPRACIASYGGGGSNQTGWEGK